MLFRIPAPERQDINFKKIDYRMNCVGVSFDEIFVQRIQMLLK